jgi:hypothetical protein
VRRTVTDSDSARSHGGLGVLALTLARLSESDSAPLLATSSAGDLSRPESRFTGKTEAARRARLRPPRRRARGRGAAAAARGGPVHAAARACQ